MKRIATIVAIMIFVVSGASAQKFAYIDSDYIMQKMPAYKAAQEEIDEVSKKWQEELEDLYKEIEKKYKDYQAEEVLLPDDIKKQRQEEIFDMERKAKEYKKKKFGYDGELYTLQDEKIKPVQDQIFTAVTNICKEKRLDFIFDKSGSSGILYANPTFDRTKDVLTMLGIKD